MVKKEPIAIGAAVVHEKCGPFRQPNIINPVIQSFKTFGSKS